MTCPKCTTGLMVRDWCEEGGVVLNYWSCVNCSYRHWEKESTPKCRYPYCRKDAIISSVMCRGHHQKMQKRGVDDAI